MYLDNSILISSILSIENNGFNNLIDITAISFYKIFGFPTGIGALIIKKDLNNYINKSYFGGGTVSSISAINDYKIFKNEIHDYFEDGTINYISIYLYYRYCCIYIITMYYVYFVYLLWAISIRIVISIIWKYYYYYDEIFCSSSNRMFVVVGLVI